MKNMSQRDVVIVGAGVAGLSALNALDPKMSVTLLNPGKPTETGSTWRAQGGVAVALGADDSSELHAQDTHAASRFLATSEAVRLLTEEGPLRVQELLDSGLNIDRTENGVAQFGLEAAHCRARVIHHKDRTGKALIGHLWNRAKMRPNLEFSNESCTQILVSDSGVAGVLTSTGRLLRTPRVVLASGGFAGLFEATTTGREVRGEGIVLAAQAGAKLKDLEFIQFHPTAFDLKDQGDGPLPLLTEALRGGGAKLRLEDGTRFVDELLPRDEVARAIASQRARGEVVYLDIKDVQDFAQRFPGAASELKRSPRASKGWFPVRPAAHYTIGGVQTDVNGRTTVEGLYACGEVASVGVHGANRLASNSLLEGLVFGHRAGVQAATTLRAVRGAPLLPLFQKLAGDDLKRFQRAFEEACGVVRTSQGLGRFLAELEDQPETFETWLGGRVASAALQRTESVGAHFRADSPGLSTLHHAG